MYSFTILTAEDTYILFSIYRVLINNYLYKKKHTIVISGKENF
jgi:hypothetical protein